ncbi:hypothetical protein EKK58_09330 [Candidatus Dependentiae bacterium]|nr:MAG: hypothetical protein EKK58_09330 [Candidatus Dependentiae bacterium]
MARVNNPLIGHARGRVGNAVFSTWKGKNIIKEKPATVANPRTANQIANRTRFTAMIGLGKLFRPVLPTGFKEYASSVTWLNRFMTVNSNSGAFFYNQPQQKWDVDYQKLVIAEGALYPTPFSCTGSAATDELTMLWDPNPHANQSANDDLYVAVVGPDFSIMYQKVAPRSTGTLVIDVTTVAANMSAGDLVQVIAFFQSPEGHIVSNSIGVEVNVGA